MRRTFAILLTSVAPLVSCVPEDAPAPLVPAPTPPAAASAAVTALAAPAPALAASTATSAPEQPRPAPLAPPVLAKLVEVTAAGASIPYGSACDTVYVAVAKGTLQAAGQTLAKGDSLMASQFSAPGSLDLKGSGLAVTVVAPRDCTGPSSEAGRPPSLRVVRAGDTKDLVWAAGAMHAHLDFEKDVSPDVYVGRLEGTAPVAEHDHPSSWEVLCAIEGSGTFTLDGTPRRISGPAVVAVPPGRKHSWQPDPGVKLVAVQAYAPPGPEQRFKALASKP